MKDYSDPKIESSDSDVIEDPSSRGEDQSEPNDSEEEGLERGDEGSRGWRTPPQAPEVPEAPEPPLGEGDERSGGSDEGSRGW